MTVLVIDIGSSSVRALLFDSSARLIPAAFVQHQHQMQTDRAGAAYFEVEALQHRVERCIDEVLQHPAAATIQAVGLTTFASNCIGLGADNQPLTPLLTYADSRSSADLETLRHTYLASDTLQRTGCPHHTAYWPGQLAWLHRTQPDVVQQVRQWVDFGSYLYRQWFGVDVPMSYSMASWSGLLNRDTLTWDDVWLRALGMTPQQFPTLADYTATQHGLQPSYALRWPHLLEVPIYLAVGDGAAATIGVGVLDECSMALTVGTTAALRMISSDFMPPVPQGLWAYRVDATRHLIGGATSEGGNVYQWARDTLNLPPDAEQQIIQRLSHTHGLTFVPHLAGERSPNWNPHATGSIHGLRLTTSAVDILQAALEGVAHQLALIAERLPNAESVERVYGGGGALRQSAVWPQIMADALRRELVLIESDEVTARGCACMVLSHLTNQPLAAFEAPTGRVITPRLR
ncbi:MAG: gluconokinase [Anaerolineales bacterium]|nr:gluconokinase [Anaerolineales bacterium]